MLVRIFGALAVLLVACGQPRRSGPTPTCPPAAAASLAPGSDARAPAPASPLPLPAASSLRPSAVAEPAAPAPDEERLYPGPDGARIDGPKKRHRTAVLLFAPPRSNDIEPLARIETLAFQPVLCSIEGRLHAGLRCGEVMPRRTTVRLTSTSSGDDTMEVTRSTSPFVANTEDGTVTYPAPYAPSCCSYKRCDGKTIPYRPVPASGFALATTKTILAVWPADADVDLDPKTAETDATTPRSWSLQTVGPRKLLQLATSDMDHDGKLETLVYEWWANDFGLDVFVAGTSAPLHQVRCGNI